MGVRDGVSCKISNWITVCQLWDYLWDQKWCVGGLTGVDRVRDLGDSKDSVIDEGGCGLEDEGIHVAVMWWAWGSSVEYVIVRPQDSEIWREK